MFFFFILVLILISILGRVLTITAQSQSPAVVKFNVFYKMAVPLKQGLHQRTVNCRVYKYSGPDLLISANYVSSVTLKYLQSSKKWINDPNGLEKNLLYDEGQTDFFSVTTQSQSLTIVKFNIFD